MVPCDLKRDKLDKGFAEMSQKGQRVHIVPADVTVENDIRRVVKGTTGRFGSIDILVNCAGVLTFGKLDEADPCVWDRIVRTNAYAPWRFMVEVLSEMRKAGGGSIVNISSEETPNQRTSRMQPSSWPPTKANLLRAYY